MKRFEMPDANRAAKVYWAIIIPAAALVCGWVAVRGLGLFSQPWAALSRIGLPLVVLTLPLIAASWWTYKTYFRRSQFEKHETSEINRLHLGTVEALATAIDAKDQTTHCHVRRVQIYADGLGKLLGLSEAEIAGLETGSLLHDVGKLAVPDQILNKPGPLTIAEFEKMKLHTTVGTEILSRIDFPYPVLPIVRHHHEQWNGRGYPDGLKGEQIPITARIMAVVDCFDSVREERPFRPGRTREQAIEMLQQGSGSHFDPKVVELFIENLPRLEAEIAARGLDNDQIQASAPGNALVPTDKAVTYALEHKSFAAYDQIRNAHREVYALYEIARTFGSSLQVENTIANLIDKVSHIVPFDTCAVYLYDEIKGYARVAHIVGKNANQLREKCITPGEGITGFALANRRPINRVHPSLDVGAMELPDGSYRAMASLPLFKDDLLLGAVSVYSMDLKEYTDDHIRLLETVTRLASDALSNATNHARAKSNALTDSLTGLPNARCLQVRFEEEVARSRRTGTSFQVVMLDLDEFKTVNDSYGHSVGDRMLREVAAIIHTQLREYDFLARYAGDEFVAIVQDLSLLQIEEMCERIEKAVGDFALNVHGAVRTRVGISAGAAVYGTDGESLDQLLISADQAMYRVKSTRKRQGHMTALVDAASDHRTADLTDEMPARPLATSAVN